MIGAAPLWPFDELNSLVVELMARPSEGRGDYIRGLQGKLDANMCTDSNKDKDFEVKKNEKKGETSKPDAACCHCWLLL